MNNSQIVLEPLPSEVDIQEKLQEEEAKMVRIITAIRDVKACKGWATLAETTFLPLEKSLKKELMSEAKKDDPDVQRLNRISGKLHFAERFANLDVLETDYSKKLVAIKKQLHG